MQTNLFIEIVLIFGDDNDNTIDSIVY